MPNVYLKPNRLQGYDYSRNGAYFITICTINRDFLFWMDSDLDGGNPIANSELSSLGEKVELAINNLSSIYPEVIVETYAILPNHIHLILLIASKGFMSDSSVMVPRIINQFKGNLTKIAGRPIWQKNYFDRVIRDEKEFSNIWQYIDSNPENWENDQELIFK